MRQWRRSNGLQRIPRRREDNPHIPTRRISEMTHGVGVKKDIKETIAREIQCSLARETHSVTA